MRRLVKSLSTHEYFCQGRWTPEASQAQHFSDAGTAIETCLRYHLTDVELVLQINAEPQEAFDTHLPLFDYRPKECYKNSAGEDSAKLARSVGELSLGQRVVMQASA